MLGRILSGDHEKLLARERDRLGSLREALVAFAAAEEDRKALESSIRQLDELFLLVVVGEFNAGKSAFINALVGQRLLEEGVTPTTSRIQLLTHGPANEPPSEESGVLVVRGPLELLREIHIVDTPGTNAIQREHEALTRRFLPRSDLVLFVTSADRPFTESERQFLTEIRDWGKKIVVAINKVDILEGDEDRERVVAFVAEGARDLLGTTPEIFAVSAKRALAAKLAGPDGAAAPDPGFERLERYVAETLDDDGRIRLKLANPLGVGKHLAEKYRDVARQRVELLAADVAALGDVEGQLGAYREDMDREFRFRLADVDNVLHELELRGIEYFDETMRLARVFDLLNRAKLKAEFERKVIGDTARRIDDRVAGVIDWMVESDLRQWKAVMEHVEKRREVHADRIVGKVGAGFEVDRARLLDTVGRAARRAVDGYDQQAEASRMADAVQGAVASTAIVEVGAVGLGAAITLIASSTFADVTGLLAAGAVAALGLFVIPSRRRRSKEELTQKIGELRHNLMEALTAQFSREIEASERRIREAVAPYTRFVRTENERLEASRDRLAELAGELGAILEKLRGDQGG